MVDFENINSIEFWIIPDSLNNYPKCKKILDDKLVFHNINENKLLVMQDSKWHTFAQTPMSKLGAACFDLTTAVNNKNFKTPEAADNFLSGKLLGLVTILQKTKNYLRLK